MTEQDIVTCERCKCIFGNKQRVCYGYYRENDTSLNAFVAQTGTVQLKDGECPLCRHITKRDKK